MNRDDLKNGYSLEDRTGFICKVSIEEGHLGVIDKEFHMFENIFNHDLTGFLLEYDGDIVKVYDENKNLLWEREK